MKGTKIGCREGDCGACTVITGKIVDGEMKYQSITSCLTPLGNIQGMHVVTIEGISEEDPSLIQLEFIKEGGTQCGFCTPGFVVSMTAGSLGNIDPIEAIDGNICRCTGYIPIIRVANNIKMILSESMGVTRLQELVNSNIIPKYFLGIQERLDKLQSLNKQEIDGLLVGGGTDLYVQKPFIMKKERVTHLTLEENMRYITEDDKFIRIGASTTLSELLENDITSSIIDREQLKLIASTPIRNIATIAGNIINASPIADFVIILLALDADLLIKGNSERRVKLDQFYSSYKEFDLHKNEYLKEILIPKLEGLQLYFEKVSKRTYLDIASVNSACALVINNNKISSIRISAGGVFEIPRYLTKSCEYLVGRGVDRNSLKGVLEIYKEEISPISDIRGSKEYKILLLRQLIISHFLNINPDINLEGLI